MIMIGYGLFTVLLALIVSSSAETLYQQTDAISVTSNNCLGTVSIPDQFLISFDLTLDSWSNDENSFIHIFDVNDGNSDAINFRYSEESKYLYFKFASDAKYFIEAFPINTDNNGDTFHIETMVTQSRIIVSINDNVVLDAAKDPHTLLTDKPICFAYSESDYHDQSIVSGTIGNFIITKIQVFDANEEDEYKGSTVNCVENLPCYVFCDENSACEDATINCPSTTTCNVTCSAESKACMRADINWPETAGYGNISCSGEFACYMVGFPIPDPNEAYSVFCGTWECMIARIYCPTNATCSVTCTGHYACFSIIIDCEDTPFAPFELTCSGEHSSCSWAEIECPANAECDISCSGKRGCSYAEIEWPDLASDASLTCSSDEHACYNTTLPEAQRGSPVPGGYVFKDAVWMIGLIGVLIVVLSLYILHLIRYHELENVNKYKL